MLEPRPAGQDEDEGCHHPHRQQGRPCHPQKGRPDAEGAYEGTGGYIGEEQVLAASPQCASDGDSLDFEWNLPALGDAAEGGGLDYIESVDINREMAGFGGGPRAF